MQLKFSSTNSDSFTQIANPGRCSGMSADWARKTIQFGGVRYEGMLSNAKANIVASGYVLYPAQGDAERAIESCGLNIEKHEQSISPTTAEVAKTLSARFGIYILALDFTNGGGHFMGFRNLSSKWSDSSGSWKKGGQEALEFYDPNFGLYTFSGAADLRTSLAPFLAQKYGGITNMEIWQVDYA